MHQNSLNFQNSINRKFGKNACSPIKSHPLIAMQNLSKLISNLKFEKSKLLKKKPYLKHNLYGITNIIQFYHNKLKLKYVINGTTI